MPDKVIKGRTGGTTITSQLGTKVELGQLIIVPVGQSGEPLEAPAVIRTGDMSESSVKHSMIDLTDIIQDRTLRDSEPGAMTPYGLHD